MHYPCILLIVIRNILTTEQTNITAVGLILFIMAFIITNDPNHLVSCYGHNFLYDSFCVYLFPVDDLVLMAPKTDTLILVVHVKEQDVSNGSLAPHHPSSMYILVWLMKVQGWVFQVFDKSLIKCKSHHRHPTQIQNTLQVSYSNTNHAKGILLKCKSH